MSTPYYMWDTLKQLAKAQPFTPKQEKTIITVLLILLMVVIVIYFVTA
jgi:hypothetical protein